MFLNHEQLWNMLAWLPAWWVHFQRKCGMYSQPYVVNTALRLILKIINYEWSFLKWHLSVQHRSNNSLFITSILQKILQNFSSVSKTCTWNRQLYFSKIKWVKIIYFKASFYSNMCLPVWICLCRKALYSSMVAFLLATLTFPESVGQYMASQVGMHVYLDQHKSLKV